MCVVSESYLSRCARVLGVLEITGDELILCLAHAGHTMYKDVRELTFAGKLEAFFQNLLGRKTPAEVLASLTKATAAPASVEVSVDADADPDAKDVRIAARRPNLAIGPLGFFPTGGAGLYLPT